MEIKTQKKCKSNTVHSNESYKNLKWMVQEHKHFESIEINTNIIR